LKKKERNEILKDKIKKIKMIKKIAIKKIRIRLDTIIKLN
jgi:hypothetical protein